MHVDSDHVSVSFIETGDFGDNKFSDSIRQQVATRYWMSRFVGLSQTIIVISSANKLAAFEYLEKHGKHIAAFLPLDTTLASSTAPDQRLLVSAFDEPAHLFILSGSKLMIKPLCNMMQTLDK